MSVRELRRAGVLSRVQAGDLTLVEGSELIERSYRQTKRLWRRYRKKGAAGLVHGNVGRESNRAKGRKFRKKVLLLVRNKYSGAEGERFGPTLAAEHLESEDGLKVDAETLRRWMLGEGLWTGQRKRKGHRQRRARKEHFGELLQMDGSFHDWLEERGPRLCLMNLVDDATGTTMNLFAEQETLWAAVDLLWGWIEKYGIPKALYTDWKNVYVREATEEELGSGKVPLTAFGKMCGKLGIGIIAANSPQAKGRVERNHGTHQDRMIKKMRRKGIGEWEEANEYLRKEYLPEHNRRFARAAAQEADYHSAVPQGVELRKVFCREEERTVSNDWVVRYDNRLLQIKKQSRIYPPAQSKVTVCEWRDGSLHLLYRGQETVWQEIPKPEVSKVPLPVRARPPVRRRFRPGADHPWRQPLHGKRPPAGKSPEGYGKDALMETVEKSRKRTFPPFPQRLEIPPTPRDSHFPTASAAAGP